jgi:hypothetical protein
MSLGADGCNGSASDVADEARRQAREMQLFGESIFGCRFSSETAC